jgi:hypothetical protein
VRDYENYNTGKGIEDWVNYADDMDMFSQPDSFDYARRAYKRINSLKAQILSSIKGWQISERLHGEFRKLLGEEGFNEFLRLERL